MVVYNGRVIWILLLTVTLGVTYAEDNEDLQYEKFLESYLNSTNKKNTSKELHYNCRNNAYKGKSYDVLRFLVPDEKVDWKNRYRSYYPVKFTDEKVQKEVWADPDVNRTYMFNSPFKFNCIDNDINRISHLGEYKVKYGVPRNPMGRTGICGKGVLGKWGPNHTARTLVTRWKPFRRFDNTFDKPVAQFIGISYIYRKKIYWGIPGGFIDSGESIDAALIREFLEETTIYLKVNNSEKEYLSNFVKSNLVNGDIIYKGYDDTNWNTDNAWVETLVKHFHDANNTFNDFPLTPGDGLLDAQWVDVNKYLVLTSTTKEILKRLAFKLNCHW